MFQSIWLKVLEMSRLKIVNCSTRTSLFSDTDSSSSNSDQGDIAPNQGTVNNFQVKVTESLRSVTLHLKRIGDGVQSTANPMKRPCIAPPESLQSSQLPANRNEERVRKEKLFFKMFLHKSVAYSDPAKYDIGSNIIGHGTYGEVFKGYVTKTRNAVAIKRMTFKTNESQQFSWYEVIAREVQSLQVLQHGDNVVKLLDVCRTDASANVQQYDLVFEYCPYDLGKLIQCTNVRFELGDIKAMLRQLFTGLEFIHQQGILHRDVKTENILLTNKGVLKIADFGMARVVRSQSYNAFIAPPIDSIKYTNNVVTLWYRPPEILLGETRYTSAVDTWSAGCVMAEFWLREPLMTGETEQQQLRLISELCGSITPDVWPTVTALKLYGALQLPTACKRKVRAHIIEHVKDERACDLIDNLLHLDPMMRLDDEAVLEHDFFYFDSLASDLKTFMDRLKTVKLT